MRGRLDMALSDTTATPMWPDDPVVKLKFCLLPRKCSESGKSLWFKRAYRIKQRYYSKSDNPYEIVYYNWVDKNEYIIWKLRNSG